MHTYIVSTFRSFIHRCICDFFKIVSTCFFLMNACIYIYNYDIICVCAWASVGVYHVAVLDSMINEVGRLKMWVRASSPRHRHSSKSADGQFPATIWPKSGCGPASVGFRPDRDRIPAVIRPKSGGNSGRIVATIAADSGRHLAGIRP